MSDAGLSQPTDDSGLMNGDESDPETREIFLPFRVFCMRKDVSTRSSFNSVYTTLLPAIWFRTYMVLFTGTML